MSQKPCRAEACVVPALALERLRTREVLFFLDTVGQYVDSQEEGFVGYPWARPARNGARVWDYARGRRVRGTHGAHREERGGALDLLFPLLGHDRILIRIGAINSMLLHGRGLEPIQFGPDGQPFKPIHGSRPKEDDV